MALTYRTAGHIDYGKTWLVRALTGKDTDRLPEKRRRGISIDHRHAPLELPDGRRLSIVGGPDPRAPRPDAGRRRDLNRPLRCRGGARTHEDLAILRLLGIEQGVVALTKVDAVGAETKELAGEEFPIAASRRDRRA